MSWHPVLYMNVTDILGFVFLGVVCLILLGGVVVSKIMDWRQRR